MARASWLRLKASSRSTSWTVGPSSVSGTGRPASRISHVPRTPRAVAASMPVASEGCHSRTGLIGSTSSAVKVWMSGPSMARRSSGGSSPSRPGPATKRRIGASTWQHAASVMASASGLLSVGSSPRARMSPPTSRRSIDFGEKWLISSPSWRVMPSTPWCGSISAKVCGSSAASRGRVEPAGAIGRASAGTAWTAGVRCWRPEKSFGPRGPGTGSIMRRSHA